MGRPMGRTPANQLKPRHMALKYQQQLLIKQALSSVKSAERASLIPVVRDFDPRRPGRKGRERCEIRCGLRGSKVRQSVFAIVEFF